MKIVLVITVFESILFISFLQQFSLAAPTLQGNEDVAVVPAHVKRDAEYRNAQFGAYICRVLKATDLVRTKLQVSFK